MQRISLSQWTQDWTVTMDPHDYLHESFQLHFMCFYPLLSLLWARVQRTTRESLRSEKRPENWAQSKSPHRPGSSSLQFSAGVFAEGVFFVLYLKGQWVGWVCRNGCCWRTEPSVCQDLLGRVVQDLRRRCSTESNLGQRYLLSTEDNNVSAQCREGWSRNL